MTDKEWLAIGYQNGIITHAQFEETTFLSAYKEWFKMRLGFYSLQTADRIEVTFNKYYACADILEKYISKITEVDIIEFLKKCCLSHPITSRELSRITQILKGVLVYMRDIGKGGCPLFDWEKVKRNVPMEKLAKDEDISQAISVTTTETILREVIYNKVYYQKQSASLCLCLNFYLGLRVGELASLTFDDFDLKRNVVRIHRTETKSYARDENGDRYGRMVYEKANHTKTENGIREIPLLHEARYIYELICKHHESQRYESVYLAYDGGQTILTRSLDRTLRKLIALCEVPKFSTHDIRRTFATTLHYNGVPTRVISDLLGHGEICTTEQCYILSYNDVHYEHLQYMKKSLTYRI